MKSVQTYLSSRVTRNSLAKAAVLVAVCLPLGLTIPRILTVSPSLSLGQHFFVLNDSIEKTSIKTGDIVRFPFSDAVTGGHTLYMLKRVACLSGQYLRVDKEKDYYCGERYLGRAKSVSRKGEPVQNFVYNGIVPEGQFFALADHKDSYDSRYYGFVGLDKVVAKAYPLF